MNVPGGVLGWEASPRLAERTRPSLIRGALRVALAVGVTVGIAATASTAAAHNHELVASSRCHGPRWAVKTGVDASQARVFISPIVDTTIASLSRRPKPTDYPDGKRIEPVELTHFRVVATVTEYWKAADGSIVMVLQDNGHSIFASIPDIQCLPASNRFHDSIGRSELTALATFQHVATTRNRAHARVVIDGIGFFDQTPEENSAAPNGVGLAPVLGIALRDNAGSTPPSLVDIVIAIIIVGAFIAAAVFVLREAIVVVGAFWWIVVPAAVVVLVLVYQHAPERRSQIIVGVVVTLILGAAYVIRSLRD